MKKTNITKHSIYLMTTINFTIQSELYKGNKKIKLNKKFNDEIKNNIQFFSRTNSVNEIISSKLGIINLIKSNVNTYDDNNLIFEFVVNNEINNIEDMEEIIYCILEPTYSEEGFMTFSVDGIFYSTNYMLKFIDVPSIKIN